MRRCMVGLMFVLMLGLASGRAKGDGLVGWWKLDGNGNDSSGLGHNGIVNGTATATPDRFGNANSALLFDRNSGYGYVSVQDHSDLRPTGAITSTAWFKPTWFDLGNYSWPAVLKKSTYPDQKDGYGLETVWVYESSPEMSAYVTLPSAPAGLQAHLPIAADTWYFAAGVYDGSYLSLYLGQYGQQLTVTSQIGSGAIENSLGELWIGADPSNPGSARSFNGAIDDVRIYDRVLSTGEVYQLYSTVPEPSTIVLLGAGAISLLAYVWRRRKRAV